MIRTSDAAPLHTKFQLAGLLAYGWWHAALAYCCREMTDGFIEARAVAFVFPCASPSDVELAIDALIREGSLHKVEAGETSPCGRRRGTCPSMKARAGGYILHDFFDYQERAQSARLRRRDLSTYGRKGGEKKRDNRLAEATSQTLADPSTHSVPILSVPIHTIPKEKNGHAVPPSTFQIPGSITEALNRCPTLGATAKLRSPAFWQAEVRANGDVDIAQCLFDAEAWLKAKGRTKKDYGMFIHNWLRNQERHA